MSLNVLPIVCLIMLVSGCSDEQPITEQKLIGTWQCGVLLDEHVYLDIVETYLESHQYKFLGTYVLSIPNGRKKQARYQVSYSGDWSIENSEYLSLRYEDGYALKAIGQENQWAREEVEWIMSHKPQGEKFGASFKGPDTLKLVYVEYNEIENCKRLSV